MCEGRCDMHIVLGVIDTLNKFTFAVIVFGVSEIVIKLNFLEIFLIFEFCVF